MALGAWNKARFNQSRRVRVAVVGPPEFAADLAGELEVAGIGGYEVVGWFGEARARGRFGTLRFLGPDHDFDRGVTSNQVALLVCVPGAPGMDGEPHGRDDLWARVCEACLEVPTRVMHANQLYEELLGHVPLGTTDAAWFRYLMHPQFRPTAPLWKRTFDLGAAMLIGVIAAPIVGLAAVVIRLGDGDPAIYRQRRIGEQGREFHIFKLRTMVADAERDGPQWAHSNDERVTRFGRFLRRTHLDELPQLWNVLRGEMTLVGPRPERPEIVSELERRFAHYSRRHLVKPGITGWAQLRCGYAGSELGTAWKLCHDLFYIKRRSLIADCLIMIETAFQASRDAHRALRAPAERFIVGSAGD